MRFFFFHLMPYQDLDLDYDKTHRSAWVTLPNSYYDPVKGHALYNRYLDELEYADALGFDGICVNEHHQTAYGMMAAPNVLAGALARRTQHAKIAILGRALPLVNNPLAIAEEFAKYHSTGVNPTESHDRFHEAHDLIVRAWTEPGPFAFEGKYYHFNYVNSWPRPYQTPHPPIWIPSQGSSETIRWAAAAARRYPYLQTFSPVRLLFRYMAMYREEAQRAGYEASPDQLGWSIQIYVAENDAIALREARPHIEAFVNKFLRMPTEMLLPPGYLSLASMRGVMQAKRALSGPARSVEDLIAQGTFLCGIPATISEKLAGFQDQAGFNILLPGLQFGTLPAALTRKNMEMFAREVMPRLRDRLPQGPGGTPLAPLPTG